MLAKKSFTQYNDPPAPFNIQYSPVSRQLPTNYIVYSFQDRAGYLWFSTLFGLYRYDGYEMKLYGAYNGLLAKDITSIAEDANNNLWLHSRSKKNIYLLNTKTGQASLIKEKFTSLAFDPAAVTSLKSDAKGNVFIAINDQAIFCCNKGRKFNQLNLRLQEYDKIGFFTPDNKGGLWISTSNSQNKNANNLFYCNSALRNVFATSVHAFDIGDLSFYNSGIAYLLVYGQNAVVPQLTKLQSKPPYMQPISNKNFTTLLGSLQLPLHAFHDNICNKFYFFDGANRRVLADTQHFVTVDMKPLFAANKMEDAGLLVTTKDGASFFSGTNGQFSLKINPVLFNHYFEDTSAYTKGSVRCIAYNNDILSVHNYYRPFIYEETTKRLYPYSLNGMPVSLAYDAAAYQKGFVVTWETVTSKISLIDEKGVISKNIFLQSKLGNHNLKKIYGDSNGIYWISDFNDGIYGWNPGEDSIALLPYKNMDTAVIQTSVNAFFEKDGIMWIGTNNGLFNYNFHTATLQRFQSANDSTLLNNTTIADINYSNGNLWLATHGDGILKINLQTLRLTSFNTNNGVSSNYVHKIFFDADNNLWASSNNGISLIAADDERITTYFEQDGLPSNEFNYNAGCRLPGGTMLFGGIKGIVMLKPDSIPAKHNAVKPVIAITGITINNRTENISVQGDKALLLPPDNVGISIKMSLLNFADRQTNFYAYKIEALSNDWIYLGNENDLHLQNLPKGNYDITIKGKYNGVWSNEIRVPVNAQQYWYKTGLFWFFVGVLFALLSILYFRWRAASLRQRNVLLEQEVHSRTMQLEKSVQEKEVLMKELHHRVKNNLQIVTSLLNLQTRRMQDAAAIQALQESRQRIIAMAFIHQRLYQTDDITMIDMGELIASLAEQIMVTYGYHHSNFNLEIEAPEAMMDIETAMPLGLIINELLTNAFKYAFANINNPALHITLLKQETNWMLKVADNGVGLNLEQWNKTSASFGVQLIRSLSKKIRAASTIETDHGTTFIFTIPFNP